MWQWYRIWKDRYISKWLDIKAYFCEPYASYQRGSNEHVNGLIRRLYKKGTDFTTITDDNIVSANGIPHFC